ncbi:energy transducer TonB [Pontibacter sp. E15-1]|uniref:energy transducer TonB n=1 Tax=Pontibacter sp. E15-1 TaxID=2919918 RepID=UPI001F5008B3|nr:energy transducer TonB [Pontibacter sp. E15-1]MCJ8166459.1 energy transducer TonB [Pontibacter sp. E15-1]
MKTKISLLFLFFAFVTFTATAQEEKKVWVPSQVIPVAEFHEGGLEGMYAAIDAELEYPALAKRNRVQGDCLVSFTLNEDGSTSNFRVLRNAGAGTGEEAMRVAKLLKFKAPGYGLNTSIPIMFKL